MAVLSSKDRSALSDDQFAYVEPGHAVDGKTPDKFRHFPIHDAAHVRNALARIAQGARFGSQAKGKVTAAAKKFGISSDSPDTGRALESLFPEVRFIYDTPELRAEADDGPQHITGYASVFNKTSRRLGGFHEQVMPTAFADALRAVERGDINVVCRYNHKDDMVLGTSMAGTLKLLADERGLKYDVEPPRHRADVLELVERRDVRYSSFAFRVAVPGEDDEWGEGEHGLPMRRLHRVELVDVAPVLDPAYNDTSAVARNLAGAVESLAAFADADPAEVRSMLEAGQASKFFRKSRHSGQHVIPKPDPVNREESRVLDDRAVSLRRWELAEEPAPTGESMVPEDERTIRSEDEIRAAVKPRTTDQLCMRYYKGEPCVRPTGHADEHAGLCWGRTDGLPCNQAMDHQGPHTPVTISSRDGSEGAEPPEARGMSAPEALRILARRRKKLTQLPD